MDPDTSLLPGSDPPENQIQEKKRILSKYPRKYVWEQPLEHTESKPYFFCCLVYDKHQSGLLDRPLGLKGLHKLQKEPNDIFFIVYVRFMKVHKIFFFIIGFPLWP